MKSETEIKRERERDRESGNTKKNEIYYYESILQNIVAVAYVEYRIYSHFAHLIDR